MKSSGVEWIREVPEDWDLKRLQVALYEINRKNNPVQTINILSLLKDIGVVTYEDKGNQGNKSKTDLSDYKIAYPNTIVMNSMNVIIGSVGISDYYGCVSPVYYVFSAKDQANIKYINYIFQTREFQNELKKYANGILEIRLRLSSDDVPMPSLKVQNAIVDELENRINLINKITDKINNEINLLHNYKKSIITETVTKGLDRDASMKDSGIEWIGEIPERWTLKKIKHVTEKSERGTAPSYVEDSNQVKVVNQATFSQGFFDSSNLRYSDVPIEKSKGLLYKDDVLIASTGGGVLGKAHYFEQEGVYVADSHVTILRTNDRDFNSKYLFYIFDSNYDLINGVLAKGSTNQTELQSEWLKNFFVPSPSILEQNEIVKYLDRLMINIEDIINQKQAQIQSLEEYKKSIIYEYVTGKKEVARG